MRNQIQFGSFLWGGSYRALNDRKVAKLVMFARALTIFGIAFFLAFFGTWFVD